MHVILVDFILLALLCFYPIPVKLPRVSGWLLLEALGYECCYSSCRLPLSWAEVGVDLPSRSLVDCSFMVLWPERAGFSVYLCLGVIQGCRPLCCPVFTGHGKTPGEMHSDVVPHGLRSPGSVPFYPTSQSCFIIVWWISSRTFSYSYRGGAGKSESMPSCPWARQNLLFFKWRGKNYLHFNKSNLFHLLKNQKVKTSKREKIKVKFNILRDANIVNTLMYSLSDPLLCIWSFWKIIVLYLLLCLY